MRRDCRPKGMFQSKGSPNPAECLELITNLAGCSRSRLDLQSTGNACVMPWKMRRECERVRDQSSPPATLSAISCSLHACV